MERKSKIFVAGHNGLVGSAIIRKLVAQGFDNLVFRDSKELDLRDNTGVTTFFAEESPDYVFFAAGTVGGIMANIKYPASFIYDNIAMIVNVIDASYKNKVKKLLYLGSSCIYPKNSSQPIKEEYLLKGEFEETNRPYAIAKLAGIELCQSYNSQYGTDNICLIPTNLFGINDNYDIENSHLVAALIRKIFEAKFENKPYVKLWGTGNVLREILCSDEVADACIYFMNNYSGNEIINIGNGIDFSISDLAQMIKEIVGYNGRIEFDTDKPDGMYKKQLDVSRATKLGWNAKNNLKEELTKTYIDFATNYEKYTLCK